MGKLGRRTHTGAKEIKDTVGSKEGVHGSIKSLELSQNQGPLSMVSFLSSGFEKVTMKKPMLEG